MQAHHWSNLAVVLILAGIVYICWKVKHSEQWMDAVRDFRRKKLAMISFFIFVVFFIIAIMDSIAWIDPKNDNAVTVTGQDLVTASKPRSILTRLFPIDFKEATYSAPMAKTEFYSPHPPLKYPGRHYLGTDLLGNDVLYNTLGGVRPALIIGGLTTIILIPFAMFFGILAGYFGGKIDDLIQYIYSTLASIPSLLLLIALIMVMGRGITQICIALGITGWVGVCRLLRGESLKVRELEYVQAARALGVNRFSIIFKHIVPNVFHIVIIASVLNFSNMVLSEAILAYLGVGLDQSWGTMINKARDELSRSPVVWWNLISASMGLFILVLSVNFIGDAIRDILDPKTKEI
jgi:peptide/nickel transport system permease protein